MEKRLIFTFNVLLKASPKVIFAKELFDKHAKFPELQYLVKVTSLYCTFESQVYAVTVTECNKSLRLQLSYFRSYTKLFTIIILDALSYV